MAEMTIQEMKSIRVQWLGSFWIGSILAIIRGFAKIISDPLSGLYVLFALLCGAVISGIIYYCIYKKPGTKFLAFRLLFLPLSLTLIPVIRSYSLLVIADPQGMALDFLCWAPWSILAWIIDYRMYNLNVYIKSNNLDVTNLQKDQQ